MFTTPFTFMKQAGGGGTISCVVECFTSNGTWSCCPGTTCIEVVAIGAGGRGGTGGGDIGFNKSSLGGGGGGGGGVSICTLTSGFGTSQCVIVGSNSNSCFGSLVVATKGANGVIGLTNTTVGTSNACAAGGTGNFATGGFGGNSCAVNGVGCGGAGEAGSNSPGGGGAGSQTYLQQTPTCYKGGAGGAGGAGATLCGITLGAGGAGGNAGYTGVTCAIAQGGCSYGGGGGGGGARTEFVQCQTGQSGGPGIIKVTQYILS